MTRGERDAKRAARLKAWETWTRYFALVPRRTADGEMRWLETIERRWAQTYRHNWYREYRACQ